MSSTLTHALPEKADEVIMVENKSGSASMSSVHAPGLPEILQKYSPSELAAFEKKLVRKMDIRLIPILVFMFLLNILDRNSIANARVGGLEADLKLHGVQYQTALSVLWAGYISMMVPSNMLLSVVKPRIYIPGCALAWGIVSGATGFVKNYEGLVAVRFLTGFTEAPFFIGTIFLLSCWYKKDELPSRIAMFYSGYTLASAFGGLIAAGIIGNMEGAGGLEAWRWLFIIEGAGTIVTAIAAVFILPNYPRTTSWLSEEERVFAEYRLSAETDGVDDVVTESVFVGLKQALVDPKVWLLVFMETAVVVGLSFTYFFPTIVQTLGYNKVQTLLLTAPPFFLSFLFSLANAWHCGKTGNRAYHIVFACTLSAIGQIICVSSHKIGVRYFAMFMMAIGVFSAFQIILSWISATIPRPKVKRGVSIALATAISNSTNIATSYIYPKSDGPQYKKGTIVLTVALVACCASAIGLRIWLKNLNKELDRKEEESNEHVEPLGFRYVL